MPNIALIEALQKQSSDVSILYLGSRNGMEKKLVQPLGVKYRGILCGKLRRYFSWKNIDLLLFPIGVIQSFFYLLSFRPHFIFCKGGYVSLPVTIGAWFARVPVILHESDVVPGLANKIGSKFARTICVSFAESEKYFDKKQVVFTGNPVREKVFHGDVHEAKKITGFHHSLAVLLVLGGSLGAESVNRIIFDNFAHILKRFQVIHICGKGKMKQTDDLQKLLGESGKDLLNNYRAFEFVRDELPHFYALADVVITRAGANTLAEISELQKPALVVPLGSAASRGDQIVNAEVFARSHNAVVLSENEMSPEKFFSAIDELVKKAQTLKEKLHHAVQRPTHSVATEKILHLFSTL
jgi:UDP-N-acetylglucosamine--N-acetylmuramyl-(pentapeptide) pyrophosphoryl-undecaprenol N-acetylglucosamine transferase